MGKTKTSMCYYHCRQHCEPCDVLAMPQSKIYSIMQLAHSHLLERHLGPQNSLEKIRLHMVTKVCNFCQRCLQCQHTSPYKQTPALLIPISIIKAPLKWVGMDLVRLLPKVSVFMKVCKQINQLKQNRGQGTSNGQRIYKLLVWSIWDKEHKQKNQKSRTTTWWTKGLVMSGIGNSTYISKDKGKHEGLNRHIQIKAKNRNRST